MKKWFIGGVAAASLMISSVALARVDVGISIGVPGFYPAPVYVAPPPVYYPPPPVYYRPPPVYVAPPRVVYPAPVYYREGGRHWNRGHGRDYDRGYRHGRRDRDD